MSLTDETDEEQNLKDLDQNNFRKIHEKAEKVGYADGVAAGNESVFQLGFDQGYADGLNTGFNLEKYRSFCNFMSKETTSTEFMAEVDSYRSLALPDTIQADHFQYTKHTNESLENISKHQKEYLEKRLQELNEKLPKTSNLFSLKN